MSMSQKSVGLLAMISDQPLRRSRRWHKGDGRNDFTRGQEIIHGVYRVGHEATPVTVRVSTGDIGDVHAVKGGPFGKSHTTSEPDGSFHHHGEHAKGKGDPKKRKVYTNKGKNAILSLWKTFNRKS